MAKTNVKRIAPRNPLGAATANRVANAHVGVTATLRGATHRKRKGSGSYERRWQNED